MTDLGDVGTPKEAPEPATFGYFGDRLRTNPALSDVGVLRLVRRLLAVDAKNGLDAVAAFEDVVTALVHPGDVEAFWTAAEANHQSLDDVGDACEQIMEGVLERPTQRPADSSSGPQHTSPRSEGDSSSVVIDRYVSQGRPDLALGVVRTVEARSA